ncbi:hypothetical protein C8Q76DRAFT_627059 [Earliella scabrosa]|nr:hypothetical protein C8Q76DRAFT_627059 [Earliella scabrosa]
MGGHCLLLWRRRLPRLPSRGLSGVFPSARSSTFPHPSSSTANPASSVPPSDITSPRSPLPVLATHKLSEAEILASTLTTILQADLRLSDAELEYIPSEVLKRIIAILNHLEEGSSRFLIGKVPPTAVWGAEGDSSNVDRFLCVEGVPITAWMVGIVTSVWLTPSDDNRASIGIKLICDRDFRAARRFQYDLCQPASDAKMVGTSTFGRRFLGARGQTGGVFEDVYDATKVMTAWADMAKVDAARIQKTDVVLIECHIKRFKLRSAGFSPKWTKWAVNFEMLRIARLHAGPGPSDFVPADGHFRF